MVESMKQRVGIVLKCRYLSASYFIHFCHLLKSSQSVQNLGPLLTDHHERRLVLITEALLQSASVVVEGFPIVFPLETKLCAVIEDAHLNEIGTIGSGNLCHVNVLFCLIELI